jgi:hypothetical protein
MGATAGVSRPDMTQEGPEQDKFHELCFYTLAHRDPSFIHQHVVDAFAAQQAGQDSTPMKIAFALIGLYLHLEQGYTGREVQQAHMRLAKYRKQWPAFTPPKQCGTVTVADVIDASPGRERDDAIERWCVSVWEAWRVGRATRCASCSRTSFASDHS